MAGAIQTVLGPVDIQKIGRTLTHEHIYLNYVDFYIAPPDNIKEYFKGDISLQNLGFIQRYPYSSKANISFFTDDSKAAAVQDLIIFQKFGGSALVENTTFGLNRHVAFLKSASEISGVHIIAGTGFYLANVQPTSILHKTVEELYDVMKTDLVSGCPESPDIKCGVIGEVASNYPIHSFEEKAIKATGLLQEQLKCPVTFHPGRNPLAPREVMRLYTEAGGDSRKAVMSHLDRTLPTTESLLEFASEFKCYLQHDLFGTEVLTYQFDPSFHMPSDRERIRRIQLLLEEGLLQRILMSHDIHTKHRLIEYGGHGYMHILCNIIPKMLTLGISQAEIDEITIFNPRNWLAWNPQ